MIQPPPNMPPTQIRGLAKIDSPKIIEQPPMFHINLNQFTLASPADPKTDQAQVITY